MFWFFSQKTSTIFFSTKTCLFAISKTFELIIKSEFSVCLYIFKGKDSHSNFSFHIPLFFLKKYNIRKNKQIRTIPFLRLTIWITAMVDESGKVSLGFGINTFV